MDSWRLESPYWLMLVPVLLAAWWWRFRPRQRPAALFSSVAEFRNLPVTLAQRVRRVLPALSAVAILLMICGLARPQSGRTESRITGEGIAIELVLDISGSMEALDFQLDGRDVNRLTAVKRVIQDFVLGSRSMKLPGRPDDLVGLVAFGGFADSKCPLTLDHGALVDIVNSLEVPRPVQDRQGRIINAESLKEELATAIGDGVALGVDRLRGAKARSKVLVLLTDGDSNAGVVDPRDAAKIAAETGIRVYTIGIGRNGVVPMPQVDEFGNRMLVPAQFHVDEDLLREMAETGGGKYFHAADLTGLAQVYAEIDKLEKTEFEETKYSEYLELYPWFAGPGLALLLVVGTLFETRLRSLP
ncbi:MAG: VWA domain-containing protein [Planctomycetes bacterium]|nr:VWA domain-containing protein [Planctomycetota bacterium]